MKISFKVSQLAKDKNCIVNGEYYYDLGNNNKLTYGLKDLYGIQQYEDGLAVITCEQFELHKILREVYNLSVEVYTCASGYGWEINKAHKDATCGTFIKSCDYEGPNEGGAWNIWEDAMEDGLYNALQLIK